MRKEFPSTIESASDNLVRRFVAREFEMERIREKTPILLRLADFESKSSIKQKEQATRKLSKYEVRYPQLLSIQERSLSMIRRFNTTFKPRPV